MVDVTHDGDHWRPCLQRLGLVLAVEFELFLLGDVDGVGRLVALLGFEANAVLGANFDRCLGIDGLGDRGEDPHLHEVADDLEGLLAHLLSQLPHHDGRTHDDGGCISSELRPLCRRCRPGTRSRRNTRTPTHLTRTAVLTGSLGLAWTRTLIRGRPRTPLLRRRRTAAVVAGRRSCRTRGRRRADASGGPTSIAKLTEINATHQLPGLDSRWYCGRSRSCRFGCRHGPGFVTRRRIHRLSDRLSHRNLRRSGMSCGFSNHNLLDHGRAIFGNNRRGRNFGLRGQ